MAHNERNAVPPNYDKNPGGNGDDINATCNCGGCCCDCVPKYVIITEHNIAQEIEEGDHLAYTMEMCCKYNFELTPLITIKSGVKDPSMYRTLLNYEAKTRI